MQRTTPQFGPVWRNSGNKRLSIYLNVEKILLSSSVESRAEAIRGSCTGWTKNGCRACAFLAVGEF